jgi:hypothetical protein
MAHLVCPQARGVTFPHTVWAAAPSPNAIGPPVNGEGTGDPPGSSEVHPKAVHARGPPGDSRLAGLSRVESKLVESSKEAKSVHKSSLHTDGGCYVADVFHF